jgi:hypothetical protein
MNTDAGRTLPGRTLPGSRPPAGRIRTTYAGLFGSVPAAIKARLALAGPAASRR